MGTHLKSRAGAQDSVMIFFAGHGAAERDVSSPDGDGLEKYLLPVEADPSDLYVSALPMREVSHIFRRIRAERLVFIVDACYSGAAGGRTVSMPGKFGQWPGSLQPNFRKKVPVRFYGHLAPSFSRLLGRSPRRPIPTL